VSASQARDEALRLHASEGERADLLTLLGGLAEDLGRDDEARDWYWRAHQACPYFNRAHDGLANVELRRRSRAWADREAILARADQEIREAPFTPDVRHFVSNWRSLPDETRKKVLHGLVLWAPYLDFLLESGARIQFKRAPERVSDIEAFAGYRDVRYSDNRLLDDIGGLAVRGFAAINLAAAAESPFDAGDITAHEVAHLFHDQLPTSPTSCISRLYQGAARRRSFVDPYASTNEFEYFAVGAEVFLTPTDAAPRFGPNRSWLQRNDPDLVRLLEQIADGRDPSTLTCPSQ
jgi:tetratricopeptide (TPR) repeat protein